MGITFKLFFPFNVTRVIKTVRIKSNVKVIINTNFRIIVTVGAKRLGSGCTSREGYTIGFNCIGNILSCWKIGMWVLFLFLYI